VGARPGELGLPGQSTTRVWAVECRSGSGEYRAHRQVRSFLTLPVVPGTPRADESVSLEFLAA
jgi:hypothetical protein